MMFTVEVPVGQQVRINGMLLESVEDKDKRPTCEKCALENESCPWWLYCTGRIRSDYKNIVFKKVKEWEKNGKDVADLKH